MPWRWHPRTRAEIADEVGNLAIEVESHLREALRLQPSWAAPMNTLAWLLATSPEPAIRSGAEALRLATGAVEITKGRDPNLLDTMAAAQAATGAFDQATQTERRAIAMISGSRADSLAAPMRERLKLYERRVAYTEPAPKPGGGGASPSPRPRRRPATAIPARVHGPRLTPP